MAHLFGVNVELSKNQLLLARAQNVTTTERTDLAATLLTTDKGLFVYDTDLLKMFLWNGTAFIDQTPAPPTIGQYRGGFAHTAAVPANLVTGDWVIFTSSGTLTNFVPGEVVQIADLAFYNGTTWNLVQGNVIYATETVPGVVQLATNAEAVAVTDATKAITPSTLGKKVNSYKQHVPNVLANTPVEVTHNLNSDFVQVKCYYGATLPTQEIVLDVTYGQNSVFITSNIAIPVGVVVCVYKIDSETIY